MVRSGNKQPAIDQAEHIGPDDTGDNIEAKRVVNYKYDLGSAGFIRDGAGYSDFRFDPSDAQPTYIGKNINATADTSLTNWVLYKFTYSGSDVTRIQKTVNSWDNRASAF